MITSRPEYHVSYLCGRIPIMATERPFQAEYAKSGRAGCKICKGNISKDSLRIAKLVQVRKWFYLERTLLSCTILQHLISHSSPSIYSLHFSTGK